MINAGKTTEEYHHRQSLQINTMWCIKKAPKNTTTDTLKFCVMWCIPKKNQQKEKKSEEIDKKKDNSSKTDLGIDIRPRTLYEENLLNPWYSILLVGKPPYL